jgi:ribosomal protein S2
MGHSMGTLYPRMSPFLFGERLGYAVFYLDLTAELLETALNVIAQVGGEMTPSLVAVHLRHSQNQGCGLALGAEFCRTRC